MNSLVTQRARNSPTPSYKTCQTCEQQKAHSDFARCRSSRDGLQPKCRSCDAAYKLARREEGKATSQRRYTRNRDRILAVNRRWHTANKSRLAEQRKRKRVEARQAAASQRRAEQADRAWKLIPGYEGVYSASEYGEIRRELASVGARVGRILKPAIGLKGYPFVLPSLNGHASPTSVHRLVAAAFLGPCPDGLVVNHLNSDKQDNRAENLEYVTRSENMRHAFRHSRLAEHTLFPNQRRRVPTI